MAPVAVTEDYYMILEVEPSADQKSIVSSYRKLAFKLHPDRNKNHDATAAFQLLQRAYETLSDISQRRNYDLIYPSLKKQPFPPKTTSWPNTSSASAWTSQSEFLHENAQIVALEKLKQERATRWKNSKNAFDTSIFETQRAVRQLEQEIRNLNSIAAAEVALEAQKNSWGTWLMSPFYKKVEEPEDVKARKDIEKQERRIEKDMKERRLQARKTELSAEEDRCRKAKEQVDAADRLDNEKIRAILAKRAARENKAREERERQEWTKRQKEREAKEKEEMEWFKKQLEEELKRQREAAEAMRKRQAEKRAADLSRQQEEREKWQRQYGFNTETRTRGHQGTSSNSTRTSTHPSDISGCNHRDWWPKVEGRTSCPKCLDVWSYLLQCPGCGTKACPKCQAAMRPRQPRHTPKPNSRSRYTRRTSHPTYDDDHLYD